jgi:S-adenosylmethionine synthetase
MFFTSESATEGHPDRTIHAQSPDISMGVSKKSERVDAAEELLAKAKKIGRITDA